MDYVLAGGALYEFLDNDSYTGSGSDILNESFLDPFGIAVTSTLYNHQGVTVANPDSTPITNGPFGRITTWDTFAPGWFDGIGLAMNLAALTSNGGVALLLLAPGALAPGSGPIVLTNDSAPWDDAFITPNSLNLSMNIIAYLSGVVSATPEAYGASVPPPGLTIVSSSPFRDGCRLLYSLPSTCFCEVSVIDIRGRRLDVLAAGQIEAGVHSVTWSGRDDRGNMAASGVYFVRLATPSQSACEKIVRIR